MCKTQMLISTKNSDYKLNREDKIKKVLIEKDNDFLQILKVANSPGNSTSLKHYPNSEGNRR